MCEFRPSLGGPAIVVRREKALKSAADGSADDSSANRSGGSDGSSSGNTNGDASSEQKEQQQQEDDEEDEEEEEPPGDGSAAAPSSSSSATVPASTEKESVGGGDGDIILQSKIEGDEMFERQGESIIMWREVDEFNGGDVDYALSFQVPYLARLEMRLVCGGCLISRHANPSSPSPPATRYPTWPAWKGVWRVEGTSRPGTPICPTRMSSGAPARLTHTPHIHPLQDTAGCVAVWKVIEGVQKGDLMRATAAGGGNGGGDYDSYPSPLAGQYGTGTGTGTGNGNGNGSGSGGRFEVTNDAPHSRVGGLSNSHPDGDGGGSHLLPTLTAATLHEIREKLWQCNPPPSSSSSSSLYHGYQGHIPSLRESFIAQVRHATPRPAPPRLEASPQAYPQAHRPS